MTFKTKHNIKRKFIRMSWNKYNIYILLKFHKIRSLIKKWALKSKNLYKHRLLNKQRLKRYYGYLTENQLQKFYKKSLKISLLNYKHPKKNTNFKLKKKKKILYFNKIKKINKKKN